MKIGFVIFVSLLVALNAFPTIKSPKIGKVHHKPSESYTVNEVGLSPGYIRAAAHFLKSVNTSADPCEDFFEFSCGRWIAENTIPEDLTSYGHFAALREKVAYEMKDLYESKEESGSRAINDIRRIFSACMDVKTLNRNKGKELVEAIINIGHWPIVRGDVWQEELFDLTGLLINTATSRSMDIFFDIYVSPDSKNVSRRMIHIDQGSLGLGASARAYYLNVTRYAKQLNAYSKYMIEKTLLIAEDAGHPKDVDDIANDIVETVKFERKLAKIMVSEDERRNYTKLYNVHKLSELKKIIPLIDWDRYFHTLVPEDVYPYIDADPDIIINEVEFLYKLNDLLNTTEKRILTNYIIWRYTAGWSFQLDERYDDIQQDFLRGLIGKQTKSPRWKDCSSATSSRMIYAAGAIYVRKHFNKASKEAALDMISDLHEAFRGLVRESDWMDNKTKQIAIEKSNAMQSLIGYPDFIYNDTELDDFYRDLHINKNDSYATMVRKVSRWAQKRSFRRLLVPVDRTEFGIASSTVNAFYSSLKNGITFPAAVLQAPLFDSGFPKAVNYGGIGSVIGHEITHGFDDQGSQFDKIGDLSNWWDNETQTNFINRTQCIIEQYSSYEVPGTGLKINGKLTQGENIADNGGVKEAYRAYKRHRQKNNHDDKRLPGFEQYTSDQIFFMSYAQTWCGKSKIEAAVRQILTDPHAPMRFRVNGVVVNQPEFAKAFNCPLGSPMNPREKCVVW